MTRLLCLLLPLLLCGHALARDLSQDEALRLRERGIIVPLAQVLAQADQRYPASRLLEAELEEDDDQYVYEIELLTREGQVRELEFDAASGRLLKDEEED